MWGTARGTVSEHCWGYFLRPCLGTNSNTLGTAALFGALILPSWGTDSSTLWGAFGGTVWNRSGFCPQGL